MTVDTAAAPILRRLDLADDDPLAVAERRALIRRGAASDEAIRAGARAILDDVHARGAAAVRDANERYGGGLSDGRLVLERPELVAARDQLAREDRAALEREEAAHRVSTSRMRSRWRRPPRWPCGPT